MTDDYPRPREWLGQKTLDGVTYKHLFLMVLEAGKSKVKVLADLVCKITSINFLHSFVFKSINLSCSLNGSFTHIGHQALVFWNTLVYRYTDF